MLKHILVPLDGSAVAQRALDYAKQVVDPTEGRMTLLTAVALPEFTSVAYYPAVVPFENGPQIVEDQLIPQALDYLRHQADDLTKAGYNVDVEAVMDDPANAIVEKAEKAQVDAIVMSTHGRSGISRWLFGSVASKVLGSAPCPVLIVPVRAKQ